MSEENIEKKDKIFMLKIPHELYVKLTDESIRQKREGKKGYINRIILKTLEEKYLG